MVPDKTHIDEHADTTLGGERKDREAKDKEEEKGENRSDGNNLVEASTAVGIEILDWLDWKAEEILIRNGYCY